MLSFVEFFFLGILSAFLVSLLRCTSAAFSSRQCFKDVVDLTAPLFDSLFDSLRYPLSNQVEVVTGCLDSVIEKG